MPVTSKDIARELNLSQPTVSRILRGDRKFRAAEGTRQRVFEAARTMGYTPNAVAVSLKRGRTGIVGLHTSHDYDVRNAFLGAVVGGLQRACADYDLDVLLHSARSGISAQEMFGKLSGGQVDGLIMHAAGDDPLVELLQESDFPVVVMADPLPAMPSVTCDDVGGMKLLIDYLWELGYRQFAFVSPCELPTSVERRRRAFEESLTARGLPPGARRVHVIDFEIVATAVAPLLESRNGERLAVCCWNDRTAYNLLVECNALGLKVPDDFAVAGFDGLLERELMERQLLTVHCPWADAARTALELLYKSMDARQANEPLPAPEEVRLPVSLWQGDTV